MGEDEEGRMISNVFSQLAKLGERDVQNDPLFRQLLGSGEGLRGVPHLYANYPGIYAIDHRPIVKYLAGSKKAITAITNAVSTQVEKLTRTQKFANIFKGHSHYKKPLDTYEELMKHLQEQALFYRNNASKKIEADSNLSTMIKKAKKLRDDRSGPPGS